MAKQQKIDMETDPLYGYVLEQLLKDGLINQQDSVLVVCGGEQDCEVFQSVEFSLVTISNLDERIDGEAYKPYQWSFQDVENLTFEDNSFDIVVVHWGLHHCRSPHQGLLEMYRVCRKGVLLFEPQDTFLTRIGVRLGFGQEYELAAVYDHDYLFGGVRNSEIPNYVYRLNKREIEKNYFDLCD